MRSILYTDSLSPMEFGFDGGLWLREAPNAVFGLLGLGAVLGELAMGLALWSRRARLVVPLMMVIMHVGILFLQNILFFDLIVLLTLPYLWRVIDRWYPAEEGADGPQLRAEAERLHAPPRFSLALAAVLGVSWTLGLELYPLTAMQMYSRVPADGRATYYKLVALDTASDGGPRTIHPEKLIPALRDGRYRRVLRQCFDPQQVQVCDDFLSVVAEGVERASAAPVELEVQQWQWDFVSHPDGPQPGRLVGRHRLPWPAVAEGP